MDNLIFMYATEDDVSKILFFIKELAAYEKMSQEVVATEALLKKSLFVEKGAEVIFAVSDGVEVGFALFFHNFSTFLGRAGLYLEDLFVLPEYRGKGFGKAIIEELARIALERNYGRMEWSCLNWNEPSKEFYFSLGARQMSDWTTFRLTGEELNKLSKQ